MGGGDVLDDRQAQPGPAGGAVPGRVDPVEPLEDPVDLLVGDADALVDHRDLHRGAHRPPADQHPAALLGVGDRVGHQVGDRRGDLVLLAEDLQALLALGEQGDPLRPGLHRAGVDRGGDHVVDRDRRRGVDGLVALQPGQLDDLLHQLAQAVGLGLHPRREPLHRLRVVGRVLHRLGEQVDRSDRGLQLVRHVGHEVTTYRLDLALLGAVLDQGQHQARTERRHPRGQGPLRAHRRGHLQLGLADLTVAPHLAHQLAELRGGQHAAAHHPHRVRRRGGLDHRVGLVHDDRAAAQHREHVGHAGGQQRRLGLRLAALLPLAEVPGEHRATGHQGAECRSQEGLGRRVHGPIVRRRRPRPRNRGTRRS